AAGGDVRTFVVDRGQVMPGRQLDDQAAVKVRQTARRQDQAAIRRARQSRYGAFDFTGIAHVDRIDLDPVRGRSSLDDAERCRTGRIGGIAKDPYSRYVWRDLLKQLQPFAAQAVFVSHETGCVAAGPRGFRRSRHRSDRRRPGTRSVSYGSLVAKVPQW